MIFIDYITATTTQICVNEVEDHYCMAWQTTTQTFVPFFDFLMIFLVLCFTILAVWYTQYTMYPRKLGVNIKNNLKIPKKNIWN
jgi:hypothetical protein